MKNEEAFDRFLNIQLDIKENFEKMLVFATKEELQKKHQSHKIVIDQDLLYNPIKSLTKETIIDDIGQNYKRMMHGIKKPKKI